MPYQLFCADVGLRWHTNGDDTEGWQVPEPVSRYKRILLKLSGESLAGAAGFGIAPEVLRQVASEVKQVADLGVEIGVVVGGGNFFRGTDLKPAEIDLVTGDQIGMLATVMNALALRDTFVKAGICSRAFSAISMPGVMETYNRNNALQCLADGCVVIFAAGTGNPLFTTDSAACLRGIEMGVDLVLKGTRVDGVYTSDPEQVEDARFIARLTYEELLTRRLGVMDRTAICLCLEHGMPVRVFNMTSKGVLAELMQGVEHGTLIAE